jgi:DNA-binding transcriptional ArsR family regulator
LNAKLKTFLEVEDLDALLVARNSLGNLPEEDLKIIYSILHKWDNPQAISNLLFHPTVIPENIRMPSIFRGLNEQNNNYYVLASIVGLQSINSENLSGGEKSLILEHLNHIIEADKGMFAARASVSILSFLGEEDASRVFKFVSHPNEATSHNILAWLLEVVGKKGVEKFTEVAAASGVSQETQDYALEKLQEYIRKEEAGELSTLTLPLYSYIPNLTETEFAQLV